MLKRITFLLILASFLSVSLMAQNKIAKPLKMDEPTAISKTTKHMGSPITAADFVKAALMPNTYGPASGDINPLVYEPISGTVGLVTRWNENGAGSGQLKWFYSVDDGATWTASETTVQEGFIDNTARYPSMTLYNPGASTDIGELFGAFAWPDLSSGGFGTIGYGVTIGLMENAFAGIYSDAPLWSTRQPIFSDGTYAYWASDNQDDNDTYFFKTEDFVTVEVTNAFPFGGFPAAGVARDGKLYVGFASPFTADGSGLWYPGYSVSEDQGATWSAGMFPDFTTMTDYDEMWDADSTDEFVSYAMDMQVDGNGYVHLIAGVADTATFGAGGSYAIVEFFETASGWDYKTIAGGLDYVEEYSNGDSPGLGQTVYNCNFATNEDGDVYAATWVYAQDSLCDVYMSYRADGGEWSAPMNLTETPLMNENGTHLANVLKDNGDGSYVAFPGYWYEDGSTTNPPDLLAPTAFYVAAVEFTPTTVSVDDNELVNTFSLQQNYPNPFNPSTSIKYSVPQLTNVSVKVYDVLGKEVATLIDAQQAQGVYEINFDASELASGMYIYTIKAGSFTSSKKMLLMK